MKPANRYTVAALANAIIRLMRPVVAAPIEYVDLKDCCIECKCVIPPGRPGRKCKRCRGKETQHET